MFVRSQNHGSDSPRIRAGLTARDPEEREGCQEECLKSP